MSLLVPLAPGVDVAAADSCGGSGPIDPGEPDAAGGDSETMPEMVGAGGAVIDNGGPDCSGTDDALYDAEDDEAANRSPTDGHGARRSIASLVSLR